ncbi:MAG: aquaporin [Elusimicrobiota bacterium]|jgi:aquaporin Z
MTEKLRPALVELIGTFAFFFIGAGSIITDSYTHGGVGLIGIALAHGLILSVMVSAFGPISGGHFNPAISLGAWVGKKIKLSTLVLYVIAQLIGGSLAGFLLRAVFSSDVWMPVHLGTPALAAGVSPWTGVVLEAVLTFFLVLAVFGTAIDSMAPKIGGFGIGLTVTADILVGGPLTGAAMNPARVFGPALAAGFWEYHWLYWVGPLIGGAAAGWLYTRFLSKTV